MKNVFMFACCLLLCFSCKEDVDPVYVFPITINGNSEVAEARLILEGKTEIGSFVSITNVDKPDLSFLKNITKIEGDVYIEKNTLEDLSFFSGLEEVQGVLQIGQNINLPTLEGLDNLQEIEGIEIYSNDSSLNINALKDVKITKSISMHDLNETIPVFSNINKLELVFLSNVNSIIDYSFLINLEESTDHISLESNNNVTSLNGLQNLKNINKFTLHSHEEVVDISTLENLENVSNLSFYSNPKLADFCPLRNLLLENNNIDFSTLDNLENPSYQEVITICE